MSDYLSSFYPAAPSLRRMYYTKTLPYTSALIFNVISDISTYDEYSTLIASSTVTSKDAQKLPKTAKLKVGYPSLGLEEDWQCLISCNRAAGTVEAKSSSEGTATFESWLVKWKFERNGAAKAVVKLDIELKFRGTMVDSVFAQLESSVAEKMMLKFERRIGEVEAKEKEKEKGKQEKEKREQAEKAEQAKKAGSSAKGEVKQVKAPPKKLEVKPGNTKASSAPSK